MLLDLYPYKRLLKNMVSLDLGTQPQCQDEMPSLQSTFVGASHWGIGNEP